METKKTQITKQLTEKEYKLLQAIDSGMDDPREGWLHEISPKAQMEGKTLSGVMSSLVQKGFVESNEDYDVPGCFWVTITEEGIKALAKAWNF